MLERRFENTADSSHAGVLAILRDTLRPDDAESARHKDDTSALGHRLAHPTQILHVAVLALRAPKIQPDDLIPAHFEPPVVKPRHRIGHPVDQIGGELAAPRELVEHLVLVEPRHAASSPRRSSAAGRASRRWWSRGDWVRVTSLEAIVLHKPEFRPPAHTVRDGNPPDILWPRHLYRISPWAGCGSGCPAFPEHRARIPATPM